MAFIAKLWVIVQGEGKKQKVQFSFIYMLRPNNHRGVSGGRLMSYFIFFSILTKQQSSERSAGSASVTSVGLCY